MPSEIFCETARLLFRAPVPGDALAIFERYAADPSVEPDADDVDIDDAATSEPPGTRHPGEPTQEEE